MPSGCTVVVARIQREILRPTIYATVRSTSNPRQARQRTQESASRSGARSRTFFGPQFSEGRRHDSRSPRYPRLSDKDSGPLEELSISTLFTPLRWSCGSPSSPTLPEFFQRQLPTTNPGDGPAPRRYAV